MLKPLLRVYAKAGFGLQPITALHWKVCYILHAQFENLVMQQGLVSLVFFFLKDEIKSLSQVACSGSLLLDNWMKIQLQVHLTPKPELLF